MTESTMQDSDMSFEDALQHIREIVTGLENGDLTLEESISTYQRGAKLIDHCREMIAKAELRITELTREHDS
ncbi:MAG TPA: exodeoxyribonuclease VII small subunit [Thermomicrobiales bacterium]|nr:exodeoxyribonuclease VII small subunit [Thermomicrobiales bacterium]